MRRVQHVALSRLISIRTFASCGPIANQRAPEPAPAEKASDNANVRPTCPPRVNPVLMGKLQGGACPPQE